MASAATILEGKVTVANGTGFKLGEYDGWLNLSRYAKPADVFVPRVGEYVRVQLDGSSFVRKVAPAEAPSNVQKMHNAQGETAPAEASPEPRREAIMSQVDAKDLRITRLAVLNTATAILYGNNGRGNADEVLELAAKLEAWVLR